MTAALSVQAGLQESNSPVQAKPGGCKMMPRFLRSPKIKGLIKVVLMCFRLLQSRFQQRTACLSLLSCFGSQLF